MKHNDALDGVRAFAVLAVVAVHCKLPGALGGMIGVDVFFVLSGFLITGLLRAELLDTGRIALTRFWWRRALRLWPALLTMLALYAAAAPLLFPVKSWQDVMLVGLYLSDYSMAFWQEPDYLSHTWSLAVEEHFYLLWPFVILLIGRLSDRKLLIVLVLFFITATAWRFADAILWRDWYRTYYRFDTRLSGLVLGGAIAVLPWRPRERQAVWLGAFALAVLLGLLTMLSIVSPAYLLPGVLLAEFAAAALILSLLPDHPTALGKVLSVKPAVHIGLVSYSVYLWHFPIVRLLRETEAVPWLQFVVTVPLSIGIAALSWHFIEKPLKALRHSRSARLAVRMPQ